MAKSDEILTEVKTLKTMLYGKNGFEGDIPEIKEHLKNLNNHLDDHSKRLTIAEVKISERTKTSKKTLAGWVSFIVAVAVALWKAFNNQPP